MNSYYLVARNREDNTFNVLSLDETWYLGKKYGREGFCTRDNDLEAIDLVTSRFSSERELSKRLKEHNYVSSDNLDIFVVSKTEKDEKTYVKFLEPIYNFKSDQLIGTLRTVARESLNGGFDANSENVSLIYDRVIDKMFNVDDFYCIVSDGDTNIPKSFLEQIKFVREHRTTPYYIKDDFDFGVDDYAGARNIVEAITRFDGFKCFGKEDRFLLNDAFIENNLNYRMAIVPELISQLDKNYVDGQLSLFSQVSNEQKVEAVKEIVEEFIPEKVIIPRTGVTSAEKKKAIYRVLRNASKKTFKYDTESKQYKVNYNLFQYTILDDERRKLDTYLTGCLPKYFSNYIVNYNILENLQGDGMTPLSETRQLENELENDAKKINTRFRSERCLNMAYEWCMLYDGIKKREKMYNDRLSENSEDKAKVYEKK